MPEIDIQVPAGQDTSTHTRTVGGRVMSPAVAGALQTEQAANVAQAGAQERVGQALSLQETVKAEQQDRAAAELRRQSIDLQAEQQDQLDRMAAAKAAAAGAEEAFANHKFHDYWSDKSFGKKLAAGFLLFGGGIGAAYLGQPSAASQALARAMDRDFDKQTSDLKKAQDIARMKAQGVTDLDTQFQHENAALQIKFAKANEVTAAEMLQRLTEAGVPLVEAQNNVTVKSLLARADEKRREALQTYDKTFSNTDVTGHATGTADPNKANENVIFDAQGKPFHRAQSPQAASEFRAKQGAITDLAKGIQELRENYAKYGKENPFGLTEGSSERNGIMKRVALATKTLGELGALSKDDAKLSDDIAGGRLGSILGSKTGLDNLQRMHDNTLNTMISKVGAQPSASARARFAPVAGDADLPAQGPATAAEPAAMDVGTARKTLGDKNASFDEKKRAARAMEGAANKGKKPAAAPSKPDYPIGTRATSGGKPIVMTATGWQLVQ